MPAGKHKSGRADVMVVRGHKQGGEWMEVRLDLQGEAILSIRQMVAFRRKGNIFRSNTPDSPAG